MGGGIDSLYIEIVPNTLDDEPRERTSDGLASCGKHEGRK